MKRRDVMKMAVAIPAAAALPAQGVDALFPHPWNHDKQQPLQFPRVPWHMTYPPLDGDPRWMHIMANMPEAITYLHSPLPPGPPEEMELFCYVRTVHERGYKEVAYFCNPNQVTRYNALVKKRAVDDIEELLKSNPLWSVEDALKHLES